ncbi:neuropeptide F receptor [Biomphalaria glabrata]|uniref:Neuropeptide F receptor-like n=1 Tax=Biomphalaria glabrata TaxID=6526 RepID=A0A2C9JJZ3_BIOGL|nr:neuropeptide F receptor-like [Biomphalaria glabrata]XP_055874126.1 neuropeptide F receptor-like [Biomphalaria glabrata]KAI8768261.1 neuropeptide F receptor-like [Biomphalaria glabrata]KAI8777416.1 neuropeptide F receptor [Biomphalaria glabrata]
MSLFNASNESDDSNDWLEKVLQDDMVRRHFDPVTETLLVLCFSLLITFGCLGNGLVMFVVIRNSSMRTPRNIFIINLAISDFTLCMFTQPLNMYLLLYKHWSLGQFMCKFVTMAQGTNLFVSTISITAIALDRFQVIVYPTKDSMKKLGAAVALISIWLISFLIASPALLFSVVERRQVLQEVPNVFFYYCLEDVSMEIEKRAYSVAQMVVQYVLPFIILSVAHLRICNKLRYRMVTQNVSTTATTSFQKKKIERRSRRKRKTNLLLAGIALVFALSWLPLNIFNLLIDFRGEYFTGRVDIKLAYAICHMLVLCSGCLNPVLYGWLNDNFRTEFIKILCCPCLAILKTRLLRLCCCSNQHAGVPAITLTKVSNGQSLALDEGIGNGKRDSLIVQFQTHVP